MEKKPFAIQCSIIVVMIVISSFIIPMHNLSDGASVSEHNKDKSDDGNIWTDAQNNYWGHNGFIYFEYPMRAIVKNAIKYNGITPSNTVFAYVAAMYSNSLTILNATKSWDQTEYNNYFVSSPHDIQLLDYPTHGRVAFICSYDDGGIYSINVTNPDSMSLLDSRDDSNHAGMYLDIDSVNNILYFTDWNAYGNDYLYAYDITNPYNINLICQTVIPRGKPWSPKVNTNNYNYVYVACEGEETYLNNGSVAIFNVTWVHNTTSPSMHYIKTQGFGAFGNLKQDGNYLYGNSWYSSADPPIPWALHIWDITNPTNLTDISVTNLETYGYFCLLKLPSGRDYAFLRHDDSYYGDYGVNIADINDKSHPMNIGYIPDDGGGHTRDLWRCHWMHCAYNNITNNYVLYVIGYMDNSWVTFNITLNQPPVAHFTASIDELSATFNATSSYDPDGNITTWRWDFGDGVEGAGEIVTHNYLTSGTYNVTLTVVDDDGDEDSFTQEIFIRAYKKAIIFGRIFNLTTEEYDIVFESVNIRIITFAPFSWTPHTSGEKIVISKGYSGFIGYRYVLVLCRIQI